MNKPPAFQLYAADFYMDTITWDTDDIGVYFCLLIAEWVNGPLDNDTHKLAKIAKKTHRKFIKNWTKIEQKFTKLETGKLINLRMENEREKHSQYIEMQRERGKKSAEKRWSKPVTGVTDSVTVRLQPDCNSSSSSSSSKKNKDKYMDCIFLIKEEYEKLINKYGYEITMSAIDILNAYIMSKGKKYKSHYHTLIGWPIDRAKEKITPLKNTHSPPLKQQDKTWTICPSCRKEVLPSDIEGKNCIHCAPRKTLDQIKQLTEGILKVDK